MKRSITRALGLLLSMVLVFGLVPAPALAALTRAETEEFYLQMAELGLVDEGGTLIENNVFVLSDGRTVNTLTEMERVLADPSFDHGTTITVVGTGKTVTAEQLAQALSIEHDMQDIAARFSQLAAGGLRTVGDVVLTGTPAAPVGAATNHNVVIVPTITGNDSTVTLTLTAKKYDYSGSTPKEVADYVLEYPVTLEIGVFSDYFGKIVDAKIPVDFDGESNNDESNNGIVTDEGVSAAISEKCFSSLALNGYEDVTLDVGSSEKTFTFSVPTIRNVVESTRRVDNYLKADGMLKEYVDWACDAYYFTIGLRNADTAELTDDVSDPQRKSGVSLPFGVRVDGGYKISYSFTDKKHDLADCTDDENLTPAGSSITYPLSNNYEYLYKLEMNQLPMQEGGKFQNIMQPGGGLYEAIYMGMQPSIIFDDVKAYLSTGSEYQFILCPKMGVVPDSLAPGPEKLCNNDDFDNAAFTLLKTEDSLGIPLLSYPQYFYFIANNELKNAEFGEVSIDDKQAPTVTSVTTPATDFVVGQYVPITVTFSEPVGNQFVSQLELTLENDYGTLVENKVNDTDVPVFGGDSTCKFSRTHTFYFPVVPEMDTVLMVEKIEGATGNNPNHSARDLAGNNFGAKTYEPGTCVIAENGSVGGIVSVTAQTSLPRVVAGTATALRPSVDKAEYPTTDDEADRTVTATIPLRSSANYLQLWSGWNTAENKPFEVKLLLDGGEEKGGRDLLFTWEAEDGPEANNHWLETEFVLDPISEKTCPYGLTHRIEVEIDGDVMSAASIDFLQTPYDAPEVGDWSLTMRKGSESGEATDSSLWPSGVAKKIYLLDALWPELTVNKTEGEDAIEPSLYYWASSNEAAAVVTVNESGVSQIIPKGLGSTELTVYAKCGTPDDATDDVEMLSLTITVADGSTLGIVIPQNANTFITTLGKDVVIPFSSNLTGNTPQIQAALYKGASAEGTPVWTDALARTAKTVTVPETALTEISAGDAPAYTLTLTAEITDGSETFTRTAQAHIIVRAKPATVTLTGLDKTSYVSGQDLTIGWTLGNMDTVNTEANEFLLTVEKNGQQLHTDSTVANSGSYTFSLSTPSALKDVYLISAKAKNGSDPTWSYDSRTLTVYKDGSLKILVDGQDVETATLANTVAQGATSVTPSVTNINGAEFDGLTTAAAIAGLRGELGLLKSIGIDTAGLNWSIKNDLVKWVSENADRVTLNYRQGTMYEPLSNFSYLYYLPQTILMLCGLQDGSSTVTASHNALPKLQDAVEVEVERLYNKLYLFQFTPAVKTTLSYTDNNGVAHSVESNSDGSLALYEPDGIASTLRTMSESEGVKYRGSFSVNALKSGEGNGVRGELYPLNALTLRKAAVAEIILRYPDGRAFANQEITLRGGVYRNLFLAASQRDNAYCEDARFAKSPSEQANLSGEIDQTFTTDDNGVLTVYMSLNDFISRNDPNPVGIGDALSFIFELRFAGDGYYPILVTVDGSLSERDVMRSASNTRILETAENGKEVFVAAQTVDYRTGREIDVRRHTGVVGPNANYPETLLRSSIMLWGESADNMDLGYKSTLRSQQNRVSVPSQISSSVADSTYPFSSIPLLLNTATINESSFKQYNSTKKTPMELAVTQGNGSGLCTLPLPFSLVDMTKIGTIQESDTLTELMANIAMYGSLEANSSYDIVNSVSGVLTSALGFMTQMSSKAGTVKAILMPTEDPSRVEGYFWTGMDTTKLNDLNYDANGVYTEPSYIGQDTDSLLGQINDTFTLSDFKAMADGSYFDDPSDLYGVASQAIGIPIMFTMEGWMSTDLRYNFDKGEWEVLMTGGGFTTGGQLEFEKAFNVKAMGIPLTFSIFLRGGLWVDFQTAIRYAEQLGLEWNDQTASAVNDYLTALRINAYFDLFGGLGHDKGFTLKIGAFGTLEINNENRFLTRSYLKNPELRKLEGQYLQLDGTVGLRAAIGAGPIVTEITLVSYKFGRNWKYNAWEQIDSYWSSATSGLGSYSENFVTNSLMSLENGMAFSVNEPVIKLQERTYLQEGNRSWLGGASQGGALRLLALDDESALSELETNSYPYSKPLISDDGELMVYLSDADSTAVEDVEARFSVANSDGTFPNGEAIDDGTASGFTGYGDSALSFDGDSTFAGAAWLREAASVGLTAGAELDESQQALLMNGLDVMASVWNGTSWNTTRFTSNGTQDLEPVIAVNDGKAIAAWRSVQPAGGADPTAISNERILFKIYDGSYWSETYTLYNGSSGSVKGMSAEMLPDGTAAIAYTLDDGTADNSNTDALESGSEICCAVVNTSADKVEDEIKLVRATANDWLDQSPTLTTTQVDSKDVFVLGWHSLQSSSGVEQHDIGLAVLDSTGTPQANIPDALSDMVSTEGFNGQFTFTGGADNIEALSVIWCASDTQGDSDTLQAVKFGKFGESYAASAPIEVAVMPHNTTAQHFDACVGNPEGTKVKALIQGSTASSTETDSVYFSYTYTDETGEHTHSDTVDIPKETVNLYSAIETYENKLAVSDVSVDFSTLAAGSPTPVSLTVTNSGMDAITEVSITLGGTTQQFTGLNLLPGQSKTMSVVFTTGAVIADVDYSAAATFTSGITAVKTGTLCLDYPDVGISALNVVSEQDGIRKMQVTIYNQSAAGLYKSGNRRVVLGFYSDPACTTALDGKYFIGGTADQPHELILSEKEILDAIDAAGYASQVEFNIGDYITDAKDSSGNSLNLTEIPEAGITLFVKARIQEKNAEAVWTTKLEADSLNNQANHTFESLLSREDNAPATLTVRQSVNSGASTARVTVRNNSLTSRSSGNIIVALLDEKGVVLETKQSYSGSGSLISLDGEEVETVTFNFSEPGASVQAVYSDVVLAADDNTALTSVSLTGAKLSLSSFNAAGTATVTNPTSGAQTLTLCTEDPRATVTIDGVPAENGIAQITVPSSGRKTISVRITAADNTTTAVYTILLQSGYSDVSTGTSAKPTLKHNSGGTVSVGSDWKTVTIIPDKGYEIASITVNGRDIDLSDSSLTHLGDGGMQYVFPHVQASNIITVVFQKSGDDALPALGDEAWDNPFTDVTPDKWYYNNVKFVNQNELFFGVSETSFGPELTMTRAMLVTVLHRLAGKPTASGTPSFKDVPEESWYLEALSWASGINLIKGYEDGRFGPDDPITREQLAVLLWRYAESMGYDITGDASLSQFKDANQISDYAVTAMRWANSHGLINGIDEDTLSPKGQATRAQVAAILQRFCENLATSRQGDE